MNDWIYIYQYFESFYHQLLSAKVFGVLSSDYLQNCTLNALKDSHGKWNLRRKSSDLLVLKSAVETVWVSPISYLWSINSKKILHDLSTVLFWKETPQKCSNFRLHLWNFGHHSAKFIRNALAILWLLFCYRPAWINNNIAWNGITIRAICWMFSPDCWAASSSRTCCWPPRARRSDATKWFCRPAAPTSRTFSWLSTRRTRSSFSRIHFTMMSTP